MPDDKIPESIASTHPEALAVAEAFEQRRRGEPVTAQCPKCSAVLTIAEAANVTVVVCANGHALYRARHD